jgi:hypothetical protein
MNKKVEQDLKELKAIHDRIEYIVTRQAYLIEYLEDLAKAGDLTANEVIARAKELTGLEVDYKAENVKLNTLTLKIGYEDRITKLEKELNEATMDSFQNLQR